MPFLDTFTTTFSWRLLVTNNAMTNQGMFLPSTTRFRLSSYTVSMASFAKAAIGTECNLQFSSATQNAPAFLSFPGCLIVKSLCKKQELLDDQVAPKLYKTHIHVPHLPLTSYPFWLEEYTLCCRNHSSSLKDVDKKRQQRPDL